MQSTPLKREAVECEYQRRNCPVRFAEVKIPDRNICSCFQSPTHLVGDPTVPLLPVQGYYYVPYIFFSPSGRPRVWPAAATVQEEGESIRPSVRPSTHLFFPLSSWANMPPVKSDTVAARRAGETEAPVPKETCSLPPSLSLSLFAQYLITHLK